MKTKSLSPLVRKEFNEEGVNVLMDHYKINRAKKVIKFVNNIRLLPHYFKDIKVNGTEELKRFIKKNPDTSICYYSNHVSLADYLFASIIGHNHGLIGKRSGRIPAGKNLYVWPFSKLWDVMGGLKFNRKDKSRAYMRNVLQKLTGMLIRGQDLWIYPRDGRQKKGDNEELDTTFFAPPVHAHFKGKDVASVGVRMDYSRIIEGGAIDLSGKFKFLGNFRHSIETIIYFWKFFIDDPAAWASISFGKPRNLADVLDRSKGKGKCKKDLKQIIESDIIAMNDYSSYCSSIIL